VTVKRLAQLCGETSFQAELENLVSQQHLKERLQQIEFVEKVKTYEKVLELLSELKGSHLKLTASPAFKRFQQVVASINMVISLFT